MRMRGILLMLAVSAPLVGGCSGSPSGDSAACFPHSSPVSGGTSAQRKVVEDVLCQMTALKAIPLPHVEIRPKPGVAPGGVGLEIVAQVPPQPAAPTGPQAAASDYADELASWQAAVIAGAVRDRDRRQHLPHVVFYELFFATGGGRPTLQTQGRIALPGWGDPEGQGSLPPATLGHGIPSDTTLQARLGRVAAETGTSFTLELGKPLGEAPAVTITARNPRRFLAGPIRRYLSAVAFTRSGYDGVLVAVVDSRGNPVWVATAATRIGDRGCAVLSAEAGTSPGAPTSFTGAGARACAAAGIGFS
jgi:hypothetical protein